MNDTDRKERFNKAYEYLRFIGIVKTQKEVGEKMGATKQNVSAALKGNNKVLTDNFLKRFAEAFEIFNIDWLLTGTGEMLLSDVDIHGDHNAVAGRDASVSVTDAGIIEKFLAEIAEQRKLTEAQQRLMGAIQGQVDRLLGIIEEMTKRMG